eukprot:g5709.t1
MGKTHTDTAATPSSSNSATIGPTMAPGSAPGSTRDSGDGVSFTLVGTFDDGETALEDGQRQTTAFRQYGADVYNSNKMLDTCFEQCQDPFNSTKYNYVIGSGSAGEFGVAPYVFFAVQWTAWCSCTDKLDKAIPPSNLTAHKYHRELLWGDYVGGSSIWMKTYEEGCPAPYVEIVRTGGPYVGNPPAEPLQRLDATDCVADCSATVNCVGIETNGEFCKLLTSAINEDAEQAARPKANFVLCKKPPELYGILLIGRSTLVSPDGVEFKYLGTFKDHDKDGCCSATCLPYGERNTTAYNQFGTDVANSSEMLDTCSNYCNDPASHTGGELMGSADNFGAPPYVFFAVQMNWCSCTSSLSLLIPPDNPSSNMHTVETMWGGGGCINSLWMKTYDGGCPAPYAEIVRSGTDTQLGCDSEATCAAACAAKCDEEGDCVGIETNGVSCKLHSGDIDENAEANAQPKANFVLCKKKPAPLQAYVARGNADAGGPIRAPGCDEDGAPKLNNKTAKHGVRCCGDGQAAVEAGGGTWLEAHSVYDDGKAWYTTTDGGEVDCTTARCAPAGCTNQTYEVCDQEANRMTWNQTTAHCAAIGRRPCTLDELLMKRNDGTKRLCAGTGGGCDHYCVWSATEEGTTWGTTSSTTTTATSTKIDDVLDDDVDDDDVDDDEDDTTTDAVENKLDSAVVESRADAEGDSNTEGETTLLAQIEITGGVMLRG